MLLNNVAPDCWLIVGPVVQPVPAGQGRREVPVERGGVHRNVGVLKLVLSQDSLLLPLSAGPCCHLPLTLFPPLLLPHDRGAAGAAGVSNTCQQGDRVSSESVPCLSHSQLTASIS